ncbi:hydrolase [Blastococcus sp. CT_GayMR20]|uniref:NlpC/P60 family protein n=1 Tax=Blastococcus sp. CT_GayMR20 TaxID=2559609 RepID=UPI0010745F37|nr:NlpC/P60 family protein [Blastococcus sp. CT_GayMR20]TFV68948.1 hydrolase [Blastococcus sp. CT_GayMR20]
MSTLLLPAAASLVLSGGNDADQGGGVDVTSLALAAQGTLLERAGEYRRLEKEVAARTAQLQEARTAEQAARTQVATERAVVGSTAADLYTSAPVERYPLLGLDVRDASATSDVLFSQALADQADRALESAVVRAERSADVLEAATGRVAAASSAVADVTARAADVLATVRAEVDGLSTEVAARLAALGSIPASGVQQERNQQAMARWQEYLAQLAAAGIEPPPAAELTDLTDLPSGLSPALDAGGQPVPGVAWAVIGNKPVTVLPAETVAAVSAALSQLGKPFAPATSGPDTYDCGGFTAASWLLAGYAVPPTPQDQWATGAAVPLANLHIGDLVFAPGGRDVGIYLGNGDVVSSTASSYQVAVRSVEAGSTATRVTVPAPATPNAALPLDARIGNCGAIPPAPGTVDPSWGGFSNGRIPGDALCALGVHRHALRCDAAASYSLMDDAFQAAFGSRLCITDSYRSYASQVSAFARKPALAAVPGTSNHGWALAVDLCGGINVAGSPQWDWMWANAPRFGFVQPDWAAPGGEKPEPWHWEYGYIS